MVFVTTTASKQALLILDMAGPENIPWVRMAYTFVEPASSNLEIDYRNKFGPFNNTKKTVNFLLKNV